MDTVFLCELVKLRLIEFCVTNVCAETEGILASVYVVFVLEKSVSIWESELLMGVFCAGVELVSMLLK